MPLHASLNPCVDFPWQEWLKVYVTLVMYFIYIVPPAAHLQNLITEEQAEEMARQEWL